MLEIKQLQKEYQLHTDKFIQNCLDRIKEKDKQCTQLMQENAKLKIHIAALEEENKELKQIQKLEVKEKEDYDELIERCYQAYIDERAHVVERCLKELIRYKGDYAQYIVANDYLGLLFIAFLYNLDQEMTTTYARNIATYKEEYELYGTLKQLRSAVPQQNHIYNIEDFVKKDSIVLSQVNYYIRTELSEDIYEYCTQRVKELSNKKTIPKTVDNKIQEQSVNEGGTNFYDINKIIDKIKECFKKNEEEPLKRLFNHLLTYSKHYESFLCPEHIGQLLCIGHFYKYDKLFIQRYERVKKFTTESNNLNKLYKLMCQEHTVKEGDRVTECLARFVNEHANLIKMMPEFKSSHLRKRLREENIPWCSKVIVADNLNPNCKGNKGTLQQRNIFIKNKGPGEYYLLAKVWYCKTCQAAYMTQREYIEFKKKYPSFELVETKNKGSTHIGVPVVRTSAITSNYQENKSNSGHIVQETNLNSQSILKTWGYETSKSKAERWEILTQIAIPKLGKTKVISYIKFFIRLHGSKPQMASALSEWQYDLNRLERGNLV